MVKSGITRGELIQWGGEEVFDITGFSDIFTFA